MGDTPNSILSLLALAYAESLPALSFTDICALLPATHGKINAQEEAASLLARLEKERVVFSHDGWYALIKAPNVDAIQKRAEFSRQKISRSRFFFSLMQMVPFVEASAITGSVSMGNTNEKSDIDILCVVTRGRMWMARILLLLLAELFGKRREQRHALDKLCFNCFITNNASFPLQNIASAHMLARALPLFGNKPLEAFYAHNKWTEEYVSRPSLAPLIPLSRPLRAISAALTWVLSGSIGDALERPLARWQIHRLRKKVKMGGDASGLVLRDDVVTLYYPDSKNKAVMARYTDTLKQIDFYSHQAYNNAMEQPRIEQFKEQLLKEKERLESDLGESAVKDDGHWETKRQQFDEAGRYDEEERADEVEEYENEASVDRQLETRLADITLALQKIDAGTYGICEHCKKEIGEERLTANPAARTHINC